MLCQRCGHRSATERFTDVEDGFSTAVELCRDCWVVMLGPVDTGRMRRLLEIERLLPGADFGRAARELADRADRHRQSLPAEVIDFIERHGGWTPDHSAGLER